MRSLCPVLFLALFTLWSGTLYGGATWGGQALGQLALLMVAAVELRRQRAGTIAVVIVLLWVVALLGVVSSVVPRAGLVPLALLPAAFCVPTWVARCWRSEEDRQKGVMGVAVLTALVAAWSLLLWVNGATPRPAMPLGHHGLLALWLITIGPLPVVLLGRPGWVRWAGVSALVLAASAISLSGSMLGRIALAVEAVILIPRRFRPALAVGVLLAVAFTSWPRVEDLLSGLDPSAKARVTYVVAGWDGFKEKPVLGWGLGSVPWTIGAHLEPRSPINPPGEVVDDLHCLPLQISYQVGSLGLLLFMASMVLAVWPRFSQPGDAGVGMTLNRRVLAAVFAGTLTAATGTGLMGGAVAWLAALGIAMGFFLAVSNPAAQGWEKGAPRWPLAYVVGAALLLTPLSISSWSYRGALDSSHEPKIARQKLELAVALDPAFPLYRARLAWLAAGEGAAAADEARAAAENAWGLAPLWLEAGRLGSLESRPWGHGALMRAARLDGSAALASFLLHQRSPSGDRALAWGARALAADPRLLAAIWWQGKSDLLDDVLHEVSESEWGDRGWRQELRRQASDLPGERSFDGYLGLQIDEDPKTAFSLFAFRRPPWPAELCPIPVDMGVAEQLSLPLVRAPLPHPLPPL